MVNITGMSLIGCCDAVISFVHDDHQQCFPSLGDHRGEFLWLVKNFNPLTAKHDSSSF